MTPPRKLSRKEARQARQHHQESPVEYVTPELGKELLSSLELLPPASFHPQIAAAFLPGEIGMYRGRRIVVKEEPC